MPGNLGAEAMAKIRVTAKNDIRACCRDNEPPISATVLRNGGVKPLIDAKDIGDMALLNGVDSQWDQVRKFSITELTKRGHLPKERAVTLTKDPDVMIREIAFLELARQATPLDFDEVKKSLSDEDAKTKTLASLGALLGGGASKGADAESVILTLLPRTQSRNRSKRRTMVRGRRCAGLQEPRNRPLRGHSQCSPHRSHKRVREGTAAVDRSI